MEKRGLSSIVATLIIILLTLVAVGVIWVVVQNLLRSGAEQAELGTYTLDLEIKSVQVAGEDVTVVVKRNAGEGEFVGMNFVFSNGTDSEIIRENTSLNKLDTKTFTFILTKISTSTLKSVSVVPIYKTSSGKESSGNVADEFDVPKNKSLGTGDVVATGNFAKNGFSGTQLVEYAVSGGGDIIKFNYPSVNPLDVRVGQTQVFTIYVYSPNEIISVTSVTQLDTSTLNLDFTKTGDSGEYEIWSASWVVNDTHNTEYTTTITAKDSLGNEESIPLTWTDPYLNCGIGLSDQGKDYPLESTCTLSPGEVGGVMGGVVTFGSGVILTLNAGSKFVTKGFTFGGGGGSIATAADHSATIYPSGYLYLNDGDGDRYADGTTLEYSASANLASHVMANNTLGTSDCNDGNGAVYVTKTCYPDADGDTYTSGSSSICTNSVCSSPAGYRNAANGADCNDASGSIYQYLTCYADSDGDTVGAGGSSSQCSGSYCPSGYSASGSDCDDGNINVWYVGYGYDDDSDGYGNQISPGCYNGNVPYNAMEGYDWCPGDMYDWTSPCE